MLQLEVGNKVTVIAVIYIQPGKGAIWFQHLFLFYDRIRN